MKIYTRSGDDGTTSLAGGERVPKHSLKIEAYGTIDELISWFGLLAALPETVNYSDRLQLIQDKLMHCAAIISAGKGADTSRMVPPGPRDIAMLEREIDIMESAMAPLGSFVLPGGSTAVSYIHIARTICRRSERAVLRYNDADNLTDTQVVKYINRLSDYLFVLARKVSGETGRSQASWKP